MGEGSKPIGVVLAGGGGRRIGGGKATVELQGRPLLTYPLEALRAALADVAVVAKGDTELPPLPPGVPVWREPDEPRHPLVGVVHALERAGDRGVLVCAGDLPFVDAAVLEALLGAEGEEPAVVPRAGGRLQPLLALYRPVAHAPLATALAGAPRPLREIAAELGPRVLDLTDERPFFNVNLPEDLLTAAAMMDRSTA